MRNTEIYDDFDPLDGLPTEILLELDLALVSGNFPYSIAEAGKAVRRRLQRGESAGDVAGSIRAERKFGSARPPWRSYTY